MSHLLRPSTAVVLLILLAAVMLFRRRGDFRRWRRVFLASALLLVAVTNPAVSYLTLGSLQWHYPPSRDRPGDTQAIVILGGYLRPPDSTRPWQELGDDSLRRCLLGAELYRDGEPCLVVVAGGTLSDLNETSIAEAMAEFLERLGVDRGDILVESGSTTTFENARNVSGLLVQRGIKRVVLVTDATHLLRSQWCFRRQGIETVGRGARYHATRFGGFADCLPSIAAAEGVDAAFHEWLGIAWYWLRGRI